MRKFLVLTVTALSVADAAAGLHYSKEEVRPLPAEWNGFLSDHRNLRTIPLAAGPLHDQYTDAALKLQAIQQPLTATQFADFGALTIRLGQSDKALSLLRDAARRFPDDYKIAANLGTAWQLSGDLRQAELALSEAVRLAPTAWKQAETFHLKLVQLRQTEKNPAMLVDLFAGTKLSISEKIAIVQQLAIWLPSDGRLLWRLAELSKDAGDVRTAANLLDGCVIEFKLASPLAREHRRSYRAEADRLEKQGHRSPSKITFASSRALQRSFDASRLPPIQSKGVNRLPWLAITETEITPRGQAIVIDHLRKLKDKRVSITGFMAPLGIAQDELPQFLLTQFPIGCWFCESPGPTRVMTIQLAGDTVVSPTRDMIKVTGTLNVNTTDPERFPFTIVGATVSAVD